MSKIHELTFYKAAKILVSGMTPNDRVTFDMVKVGNISYIVEKTTASIYAYRDLDSGVGNFYAPCPVCKERFKLYEGIVMCDKCEKIKE